MMYKESISVGNKYRQAYRAAIEKLADKMEENSKIRRQTVIEEIKNNPGRCREKFKAMLGWPLDSAEDKKVPDVNKIFVTETDGVSVYRLQIDVLGIPFYGILFVREDNKKRPLVIVQHGGLGAPELCADFFEGGTENYNDIIARVLKNDVNVFAPQLLLWRQELSDDEYTGTDVSYTDAMRRGIDNRLKQFGSSVAALEIFCITKCIDYFESQPYVDFQKIGMMGMSYGGFYALYTSAAETRIKCCLCCSFFNDRIKYNWTDFVWFNSGNMFTDTETALLLGSRHLYICIGDEDEVFDFDSGVKTWEELEKNLGNENNVRFIKFHGKHEFIKDDEPIRGFINDLRGN